MGDDDEKETLRKILFIIMISFLLVGCAAEKWEGFISSTKNGKTIKTNIRVFDSLGACRLGSFALLSKTNKAKRTDYQCEKIKD